MFNPESLIFISNLKTIFIHETDIISF